MKNEPSRLAAEMAQSAVEVRINIKNLLKRIIRAGRILAECGHRTIAFKEKSPGGLRCYIQNGKVHGSNLTSRLARVWNTTSLRSSR